MPVNLFTPVSVRRRSAARGCADAHTASAEPAVVGSVESVSASSKKRILGGDREAHRMLENTKTKAF